MTGESGVGKSSLINAICGYDDDDPRAAQTNIIECTDEVKGYFHPNMKNLALYDLPGAGTSKHPVETYFCDKRLYVFDCLVLVMVGRIRQTDLTLAKFAQEMGTPIVFVRNKIENDINSMRKNSKYKNMEEKQLIAETFTIIRKNIHEELEKAKIRNPNVFLIEGYLLRELNNTKFEEKDLVNYLTTLASNRINSKNRQDFLLSIYQALFPKHINSKRLD